VNVLGKAKALLPNIC